MHQQLLVLLPPSTKNIVEELKRLLNPLKFSGEEDDPNGRFDFWEIGGPWYGDVNDRPLGHQSSERTACKQHPGRNQDLEDNKVLVTSLNSNYCPGSIMTPDGRIYEPVELQLFAPPNDEWIKRSKNILNTHLDYVAVSCSFRF